MAEAAPATFAPDLAEITRIAGDPRLKPAAARVALYIYSLGPGVHEIARFTLSAILAHVTDKPVAAAVQEATYYRYVRQLPGGKNHSPRYEYLGADSTEPAPTYPAPPENSTEPAPSQNDSTEPAPTYPGWVGAGSDLSAPHTRAEVRMNGCKSEGIPPVVPPRLDPMAEAALEQHAEMLAGCRGTLRDYLAVRVSPRRQAAYVQSLVCRIEGFPPVFILPDGSHVPKEDCPQIVAAALNELWEHGERQQEHPTKYADGDIRNLDTKVSILLRKKGDATERGRRNGRVAAAVGAGAAAGSGGEGTEHGPIEF